MFVAVVAVPSTEILFRQASRRDLVLNMGCEVCYKRTRKP